MADGRMFTDYRPRCIANFAVAGGVEGNYDLPNSYEYRQYLINNAADIMTKNRQVAYQNNACGPCTNPYNEGTMLQEQSMVKCDTNKCSFYQNDATGLGTGRQYDTSGHQDKAKAEFLKVKEEEQKVLAKKENCCWPRQDDLGYFAYDYAGNSTFNERAIIPSGAMPMTSTDRAR